MTDRLIHTHYAIYDRPQGGSQAQVSGSSVWIAKGSSFTFVNGAGATPFLTFPPITVTVPIENVDISFTCSLKPTPSPSPDALFVCGLQIDGVFADNGQTAVSIPAFNTTVLGSCSFRQVFPLAAGVHSIVMLGAAFQSDLIVDPGPGPGLLGGHASLTVVRLGPP